MIRHSETTPNSFGYQIIPGAWALLRATPALKHGIATTIASPRSKTDGNRDPE